MKEIKTLKLAVPYALLVPNPYICCAQNTTSNFKRRLDSVHKMENLTAILPETVKRKRPDEDNGGNRAKRRATLDRRGILSKEVRRLVMDYVIEDMLPLTTMESPAFRKLVNELSAHHVQLSDRKTLSLSIEQACNSMKKQITETLRMFPLQLMSGQFITEVIWV